jgi:diguanylate cyclase (GGDEF)-like protein
MALEEALNQLKAVEKRIIYDFFFQDLTKTEIAKRLGYSCSHVSHLLRRALKELKRILMAEEREEIHRQLRALEDQVEPYAERAAEETIKDELTGLYSRSYIEARLEEEMARLDPHGQDLAVCLLQVDRLAAYAARYGRFDAHRAVSLIAQIIRETGRRVDRMGRYSEDQFILLLPHTGAPAIQLCERIRQKVAHKQFRRRDEPEARLTLSIGVAVLSPHNRTPRSLLNAAAAALARSLERGGNQIFLADEPPTYP